MKKIMAISLSLLMLFTNMGFSYATHFCQGKAVKSSISLGETAISCGMSDTDCSSKSRQENRKHSQMDETKCCQNHFAEITLNDAYQSSSQAQVSFQFDFSELQEIQTLLLELNPIQFLSEYVPDDSLHWVKDILVFVQSFLL